MRLINRLYRFTWFPLAFQLVTLAAFLMLIVGGLAANTDDMAFAKVLRNTNLANLIVWSYWWPLIVLSAIFLGRVWCTICPMELMTSLSAKIGLKRRAPAFLRSGWVITGFYVTILFLGIHTLAIHRVPFRMAIYMLALLGTAILTGLLFSRNAFCAHVCPVGHLLGLYARLAPLGWRVKDPSVCSDCKDKSCIARKNAYAFQGRSCGVGLYPGKLADNSECLLCGQCLKACDRNNPGLTGRPNPGWFSRRWFKDLLELRPFTAAQTAFCLVVSGFVIYEVFTEWAATEHLLLWLPRQIEGFLHVGGSVGSGLVKSLTLFAVLPALLWLLPYAVFRLIGGRLRLRSYLLRFGIAFVPIMAAAHAIKAVLKMMSRVPYWRHAMEDPVGIATARGIVDQAISLSALPEWREPVITIFSIAIMTIAVILSLIIVRRLVVKHVPQSTWRSLPLYLVPMVYGGAFLIMLLAWRIS